MARNTFNVDEELDAPFNFKHLGRAFKYIAKYKFNFLKVFAVSLCAILLSMIMPLVTERVIDVCIPERDIAEVLLAAAAMIVVNIVIVIMNKLKSRLNNRTGQNVIAEIREDLFSHLQKLPFDYYDSRPVGKILVRVVNYVNAVADFLSAGLMNAVLDLLTLVIITVFMFSVSPQLSLVVICSFLPFAVYVFLLKPAQRRSWQRFNNKQSNMTAFLAENINGVRATQSFTRNAFNEKIFTDLTMAARKAYTTVVALAHSLWPVIHILSRTTRVGIYVLGIYWFRDSITLGMIFAMSAYMIRFWAPIQNLANIYSSLLSTVAYLERIFQVMDEPVSVSDKEGAYELPTIQGNVTFLDVSFAYEKNVPVLKGITFEALEGESIALVGPTGAGKSTIINMLSRFYNIGGGNIYIDGHDINEVTLPSLRRQMGIMMQDTFIFSGNIIENIRYGRLSATDEECIAAAKAVNAHEFIEKFPNGYFTEVTERGEGLSSGQKQLISFARTMLSDPRVLILDEATSSIDTNTERMIQEGIEHLITGRTSFIVAHRLSTIKNCTKILYIANGIIAEMGSHEELIEKKGRYYQLYMSQLLDRGEN